jgi:D-tagatose-1,6-bisphosphate aldolase subunit GatZ/KbaZ
MREAIFGLARIEEEWIAAERRSDIRGVIERVMVEYPEHWKAYYHGDESRVRFARAYSLSDRIRYYWPHRQISDALALLTQNLQEYPAPMPLIAQYLPRQADAIRAGTIQSNVPALIRHKIQESLSRYSDACGSMPHAGVGSGL